MPVAYPSVWPVDPERPAVEAVLCAARVVREGGVVVYPTETFYALGGHPMLERAIETIYRVKGRDLGKPLPLIATDAKAARTAVAAWPSAAETLARVFWPGPLTLVLPAGSHFPSMLYARTGTLAVRVSSHPVARAFSDAVGGLLISTSANAAGEPPWKDPERIPPAFAAQTGGVLHAGPIAAETGMPSTLVDVSSRVPRLVRAGSIPWEKVREVLGLQPDTAKPERLL